MDIDSIPKLAPGCRLHPSEAVLLVPEGTLNLAGPARDILAQLDGKQNVATIVDKLARAILRRSERRDDPGCPQPAQPDGAARRGAGLSYAGLSGRPRSNRSR